MADTQNNSPNELTPEAKAKILADEQAAEIERLKAELAASKKTAPKSSNTTDADEGAKDETKPGGVYIVGGSKVNAEGKAIK